MPVRWTATASAFSLGWRVGNVELGLSDRRTLVTGSTRGIGVEIAEALLDEGARVFITGRREEQWQSAMNRLSGRHGGDRLAGVVGDLGDESVLRDVAERIVATWGGLDHLVCNIGSGRSVPLLQEDAEEWGRMLGTNLLAATAAVRVMLPLLEASATDDSDGHPSICFIGSICGMEALGCPAAYASAKAALEAYARSIARPLGRKGIRVNVVTPGNVLFPGSTWERRLGENPEGVAEMLDRDVPLGRLGRAREVGDVVAFLLSPRCAFVSGANWVVDGGQTRGR